MSGLPLSAAAPPRDDPPRGMPAFAHGKPMTSAALDWASRRHGHQTRALDGAPFILHPLEVAALLSNRDHDDEVIAAGLLHDIVEDTSTSLDEVAERFGERVAEIVETVTEDPTIAEFEARKAALRDQVEAGGSDAHAVYAADKIVKARELRAQASHASAALDDPPLRRRLEHYTASLAMLKRVAPDSALVRQLEFELWALEDLPPRPAG